MTIRRVLAASVFLLLAACSGSDSSPPPPPLCNIPGSLTTTLAGGNGQNGNMFDVVAVRDIVVTGLTARIDPGVTTLVEIYHRVGTHVGHETVATDWTFLGNATITGATTGPTAIPLSVNVSVAAGQRHAFYVTTTGTTNVDYTNGTFVGNVAAQDANLQVLEGTGNQYPFSAVFSPRIYNGTVSYTTCP